MWIEFFSLYEFLCYSDKQVITYLRINNDLFISIDYFAYLPSAPVRPILSLPAKSTSSSLLETWFY